MTINPEYASSWDFLERFHPNRNRVVAGIGFGRKVVPADTFRPDERDRFLMWVAAAGKDCNLYFHVSEPMGVLTKKARKEDVRAVHWLHVDVDPRPKADVASEQQRILALLRCPPDGTPPPTCIVYSGGGYQAYWKLAEPLVIDGDPARGAAAEQYNIQIERALGADSCHNIDRIMRLPGTINVPDAKKRKRGRTEALAGLVEWHDDRVYDIGQFAQASDPAAHQTTASKPVSPANVKRLSSIDDLGSRVPDSTKAVIVQGKDQDDPHRWDSRSECLFWVCCELLRSDIDVDTIFSVLTDERFGISESVLEKGRTAEKYAIRQIERARDDVERAAAEFHTDNKGNPYPTPHNIRVSIIKQGVRLWYDEFADRKFIEGLDGFGPVLDDKAVVRLRLIAEERFMVKVSSERFYDVLSDFTISNKRHPVREYLESIADAWDGVPRADTWLIDYAGAADTAYTRAVCRLPLIAAVRRIMQPGCKFDEMPVLEGPQGGGKSSLLLALCPDESWFTDDLPLNGNTKQFIESVKGKWIVEAGELSGMRRANTEVLKSSLSRQVDRARMAYGREPVELPRQCVIFGTTNAEEYLKDATGNRRFWPVRCGKLDVAGLKAVRDLLWAEVIKLEADGASVRMDPALYQDAAREQTARRQQNPYKEELEQILDGLCGKLRAKDAWKLIGKSDVGTRNQQDMVDLSDALRELGWHRNQRRFGGVRQYCYVKGDPAQAPKPVIVTYTNDGWRAYAGDDNEVPDYGDPQAI